MSDMHNSHDDVMDIEGGAEDEREYYAAIQRQINRGMWGLQGSHGRAMMEAITSGHCMLGRDDARDYYGNHIPSREQVKEGTKGSHDFVVEAMGEEWAGWIGCL